MKQLKLVQNFQNMKEKGEEEKHEPPNKYIKDTRARKAKQTDYDKQQ